MTALCHVYVPSARIGVLSITTDARHSEGPTDGRPESVDRGVLSRGKIIACSLCVHRHGRLDGPAVRASGRENGGCVRNEWFLI